MKKKILIIVGILVIISSLVFIVNYNKGITKKDMTTKEDTTKKDSTNKEGTINSSDNTSPDNNSKTNTDTNINTANGGSGESTKTTNYDIKVFVKSANFGCMVRVDATGDKNKDIKYYQVFYNGKVVSNLSPIDKETTVFPGREQGDKVTIKLFKEDKSLIGQQSVKLSKDN